MLHKFTQRHDVGAVPINKTSLHNQPNEASCISAISIKLLLNHWYDIKHPVA